MTTFYVPFAGDRPATTSINGHRLVILSRRKKALQEALPLFGAERIEVMQTPKSKEKELEALTEIGRSANGGIVIVPPDVEMEEVIKNLEAQLPWVH
jgi:hypothetical protein